jgi:predicted DNA-binding transcriptional regulator AlpA
VIEFNNGEGAIMAFIQTTKLRAPEAARYVGLSPSTLAKMRLRGDGPMYSKAGPRIVIYDKADLDDWLNQHRRSSTSDLGENVL